MATSQDATFIAFENTGFTSPAVTKDGTFIAFENTGFVSPSVSQDSAFVVFENVGIQAGGQTTVTRQPRGWGMIPTGSESITMLSQAATASAIAYENTT
jgi:hypothetical protein